MPVYTPPDKSPGGLSFIIAAMLVLLVIGALYSHEVTPEDTVILHQQPTAAASAQPVSPTASAVPAISPTPSAVPAVSPTTAADAAAERTYVLNTNTHKFHDPACSSASRIKEANRDSFTGTREEIIRMGYDPCGVCRP